MILIRPDVQLISEGDIVSELHIVIDGYVEVCVRGDVGNGRELGSESHHGGGGGGGLGGGAVGDSSKRMGHGAAGASSRGMGSMRSNSRQGRSPSARSGKMMMRRGSSSDMFKSTSSRLSRDSSIVRRVSSGELASFSASQSGYKDFASQSSSNNLR